MDATDQEKQGPNIAESSKASSVHSMMELTMNNPGNPVFSCDVRLAKSASASVNFQKTREPISKPQHPMYITSSSSYGGLRATTETTAQFYHGRTHGFSEHLLNAGMYRNHSLNTALDHSRV